MLTKVHIVKARVFPGVMYRCESYHKEGWAPKNWCFSTVVLEKTLESPLDSKEIKPVDPKGNQSWIFAGRTDAEAETPILWPPDAKNWLIGRDPDAGKDWGQEEKGVTDDEMVRWHYQLNGHEFEQTLGNGEGQRNLVYCSPWGLRVRQDWVTEQHLSNLKFFLSFIVSDIIVHRTAVHPLLPCCPLLQTMEDTHPNPSCK